MHCSSPLFFIPERHRDLGVELAEDAVVNLGDLLTHYGETNSELPSLSGDVSEYRPKPQSRWIQNRGGLFNNQVDGR